MNHLKKCMLLSAAIMAALCLLYFFGTGFLKNTSVYISSFTVSEDGTQMDLRLMVSSSVGYLRKAVVHSQENGELLIDCYSAFGGINGSIGAKNEFSFSLSPETAMISLNRGAGQYEALLYKDADGIWQRTDHVTKGQVIIEEEELVREDKRLPRMALLEWENYEETNIADLLQKQGQGMMVQLQAGSLIGSGVIYDENDGVVTILTAAHVLEETDTFVCITFCDGWSTVSREYTIYEKEDLAEIRLAVEAIPEEHLKQYWRANYEKESFDALKAQDGCIAMGSKSGVAAEAYEGVILDNWIYMEDYEEYMIWARANVMPGMSGGGLFDTRGRLLGILSGGTEDGELAVIPLSVIQFLVY